ncbi:hypothetical protein BJ138DRAFT_174383 [Hygrophoropsis aurantiaca]|uniref:Uncharacterized protein n=1 Tax=Hygrophoropsis aurantiaca TaxID=72124 RepID=A0ACB8ANS8_9AGAM|nr:hypothetical protein BJ138DRAFT_174383 [Hygrophoropsis aurantiaca]
MGHRVVMFLCYYLGFGLDISHIPLSLFGFLYLTLLRSLFSPLTLLMPFIPNLSAHCSHRRHCTMCVVIQYSRTLTTRSFY